MKLGKIKTLFNGGAKAAGVEGLESAIAQLETQRGDLKGELDAIAASKSSLALDDQDHEIDELEIREKAIYRDLEKIALALPKLHAKLGELRNVRREQRIAENFEKLAVAQAKLNAALDGAVEANEFAVKVFENACAELGSSHADHVFPRIHFPGLVTRMSVDLWRTDLRNVIAAFKVNASPKVTPAAGQVTASSTSVIPIEKKAVRLSLQHAVFLDVPPPRRDEAPRKPLREAARDGCTQLCILRAGYETPSGVQTAIGDIVAIPNAIAQKVVENGAATFAEKAS